MLRCYDETPTIAAPVTIPFGKEKRNKTKLALLQLYQNVAEKKPIAS